jgi:hypothetical protein
MRQGHFPGRACKSFNSDGLYGKALTTNIDAPLQPKVSRIPNLALIVSGGTGAHPTVPMSVEPCNLAGETSGVKEIRWTSPPTWFWPEQAFFSPGQQAPLDAGPRHPLQCSIKVTLSIAYTDHVHATLQQVPGLRLRPPPRPRLRGTMEARSRSFFWTATDQSEVCG